MAARKTTTKQAPAAEPTPEVEQTEGPQIAAPAPSDTTDAPPESGTPVDEPAADVEPAPPGYMWVQRRKPVQLGAVNPQWGEPQLIDAKSFAELEPQGWRAAK